MTSRFHAKPGVGQNIAWALTKHVNFLTKHGPFLDPPGAQGAVLSGPRQHFFCTPISRH